jgi:adenylate cyclase
MVKRSTLPKLPPRSYIVSGEDIVTEAVFRRPVEKRPLSGTLGEIVKWLTTGARTEASFIRVIDELGWRLVAAGYPLLRLSLHAGTLHPQFRNVAYMWWREPGHTERVMIRYQVADIVPYAENPVRRVREGGETLRHRLDQVGMNHEFAVLHDLRSRGATEYYAAPVPSSFGFGNYMLTYVTDSAGGLTDREVSDFRQLDEPLSLIADMNSQRSIAENVLRAYLGHNTGPRVLSGEIRRGSGELINAVIWSSDLRGFTNYSDHAPSEQVIATLNRIFDLQSDAITKNGGEILKFVGDGLLAIFPVSSPEDAAREAAAALAAANQTLSELFISNADVASPLQIVIALHYGSVTYGNIGSAERLDFTVIGPAVNLVSRTEAVAKSLKLPLVLTDDFAAIHRGPLRSIGRHELRGVEKSHEIFEPIVSNR